MNNDSVAEIAEPKHPLFDNSIWLSTKEAAIYLRKFQKNGQPSENAIRTALWRGTLTAKKWQRRLYFKKTDLNRLIESSPNIGGFDGR